MFRIHVFLIFARIFSFAHLILLFTRFCLSPYHELCPVSINFSIFGIDVKFTFKKSRTQRNMTGQVVFEESLRPCFSVGRFLLINVWNVLLLMTFRILPKFGKICQKLKLKFAKFMKISLEFGQNLSEFCHISFLQHFNFLLFSVPRFPFSYHSFQTDPQAWTRRIPAKFRKFG